MQFYDNKERSKNDICHNILAQSIIQDDKIEYEKDTEEVAAIVIAEIKDGIKEKIESYAQQFSLKTGLKIFENKGEEVATSEFDQLYKEN